MFELRLLEGFHFLHVGKPVTHFYSDKVRALLVYLAVEGKHPVRRSQLMELLWPNYRRESAQVSMRRALFELKKALDGADCLKKTRQDVWLDRDDGSFWCDIWELEKHVEFIQSGRHGRVPCPTCLELGLTQNKPLGAGFCSGLEIGEPDGFDFWRGETARHLITTVRSLDLGQESTKNRLLPLGNLPGNTPQLIGRTRELERLSSLLEINNHRLISLVGLGGIGKSHLALALAKEVQPLYPDGVWLVSLGELSHIRQEVGEREGGGLIRSRVLKAMGLVPGKSVTDAQSFLNRMREYRCLLILDEFEHLLAGLTGGDALGFLATMMEHLPGLAMVVTTRRQLFLESEHHLMLSGFSSPPVQADRNELLKNDGVTLFLSIRKRRLDLPSLRPDELELVGEICRRLDGHALGIKMAASMSQSMSMEATSHHILENGLSLAAPYRDTPERHRFLHGLVEGCLDSLPPEDTPALMAVALFRGAAHPDDIKGVMAQAGIVGDLSPSLDRLFERSLLSQGEGDRVVLHSLVRQIVLENGSPWRRVAHGKVTLLDALRTGHTNHFIDYLGKSRPALLAYDYETIEALKAVYGEIRRAWVLSLESGNLAPLLDEAWSLVDLSREVGDPQDALLLFERLAQAVNALGEYGPPHAAEIIKVYMAKVDLVGGRPSEAFSRLEGIDGGRLSGELLSMLLFVRGQSLLFLGQHERGFTDILQVLGLCGESTPFGHYLCASAHRVYGSWLIRLCQGDNHGEHLHEALRISKKSGQRTVEMQVLVALSGRAYMAGELDEAHRYLMEAHNKLTQHHLDLNTSEIFAALSVITLDLGEIEESLRWSNASKQLAIELGLHETLIKALLAESGGLREMGQIEAALSRVEEGLSRARSLRHRSLEGQALLRLGLLQSELGNEACKESVRRAIVIGNETNAVLIKEDGALVLLDWALRQGDLPEIIKTTELLAGDFSAGAGLTGTRVYWCYERIYRGLCLFAPEHAEEALKIGADLLLGRLKSVKSEGTRKKIFDTLQGAQEVTKALTELNRPWSRGLLKELHSLCGQ